MADPIIDVLIPVYNGAGTIESALASIQRQSVEHIRIVVVDDGSTDETPEILARLQGADPRLCVIRQRNGGIVDALNAGLAACRADLIARHDADDLAHEDRFAIQLAYLTDHPDCVAVSGAVDHIDEAGKPLGTASRPIPPDRADPDWAPSIEPYLMHPFLMVRRSAMEAVGGFRHCEHAEDTDLYWRLLGIGRLHNLDRVLGQYRVHAGSISGRSLLNGRVGALAAQLAAISAKRRRSGRQDLAFPKLSERYRAARSYDDLLAIAEPELDAPERAYLHVALAAKMLELTSYRPYELERADCLFVRDALDRHGASLRPENVRKLAHQRAGTAARLLQKGRFGDAAILLAPADYPGAIARLIFKLVAPRRFRAALSRRLAGGRV